MPIWVSASPRANAALADSAWAFSRPRRTCFGKWCDLISPAPARQSRGMTYHQDLWTETPYARCRVRCSSAQPCLWTRDSCEPEYMSEELCGCRTPDCFLLEADTLSKRIRINASGRASSLETKSDATTVASIWRQRCLRNRRASCSSIDHTSQSGRFKAGSRPAVKFTLWWS